MKTILSMLPGGVAGMISALPEGVVSEIEEIRCRVGRPVEVSARGKPQFLPYVFSKEDAERLIGKLSNHSLYAMDEELRMGYVTIEGGHRVGLAGKVILEGGSVKAIRHLSSFNIRVAREKIGIADPLIPLLFDGQWRNTMIIGAPQTGKTTLLRDLARWISLGSPGIRAHKVGIVDERSEIAGCVGGVPSLQFGPRVDVLDACPKAEGMMMMIRSMSPEVLIADEIGRSEDSEAIMEAVNAGIGFMMTTHGSSLDEVRMRPLLRRIIEDKVFSRFILLARGSGPGTVRMVLDEEGRPLKLQSQGMASHA